MKAGFIGLGTLGKAMAQRLIAQGVGLTVWNRTPDKVDGLDAAIASSPAGVMEQVTVIFINVRDSRAVRDVLTGKHGLLTGDCTGKVIIDTTTNHFEPVLDFYAMLKEHGGSYVEAPVVGSVAPALKGALTVLASGDQSAFDIARPYLEKIGGSIFYLGEPGLATKMKLINNMVLGTFMAALAEAVAFGEAVGLDKARVIDMLSAGAGKSLVLDAKRQRLLDEDYTPHFSAALLYKDLDYAQDLARAYQRPLFTGSAVKELYALAFSQGQADKDFSVIYDLLNWSA